MPDAAEFLAWAAERDAYVRGEKARRKRVREARTASVVTKRAVDVWDTVTPAPMSYERTDDDVTSDAMMALLDDAHGVCEKCGHVTDSLVAVSAYVKSHMVFVPCRECGGDGCMLCDDGDYPGYRPKTRRCPECEGASRDGSVSCERCKSKGYLLVYERKTHYTACDACAKEARSGRALPAGRGWSTAYTR